jgi:hypothetical protein
MYEYIYLGSSPADEECAQLGNENYYEQAQKECNTYIRQLKRLLVANGYIDLPTSFSLVKKSEAHDFGNYYEVAARVKLDQEDTEYAFEIAMFLDANVPAEWDEISRKELSL